MRVEAHDYHAVAAVAPDVGERGRHARRRPDGAAGGLQGIAAEPPPPRAIVVGHRWDASLRRAAALPRPQPDLLPVARARRAGCGRGVGRLRCPRERLPRRCASSTARRSCAPASPRGRAPRPRAPRPAAAEYDTVIVGAGPAGLAAAVYGASEGLRTIVVEREAPGGQAGTSSRIENYLGFPSGVSGDELASRALQQARRLGAEILVTRDRSRASTRSSTRSTSTAATCCAPGRSSSPAASRGGTSRSRVSTASPARASSTARRAARRRTRTASTCTSSAPATRRGRRPIFFSTHARSVTILCRGDGLEKSMSRYLIDQIAARSNVHVMLARRGRRRARRDLARGDRRPRLRDRRDAAARIGRPLHLHRRGRGDGMASAEIALDRRGYVLTGSDVPRRRRGRSTATRTCWRRASRDLRLRRRPVRARSSASPPRSARAAWRSPSFTST